MGELRKLPGIGPVIEAQLNDVGINTLGELKAIGAKEAWLRILSRDPSACIMRLGSLEAAVRGMRRSELDAETKADLKAFYREHK